MKHFTAIILGLAALVMLATSCTSVAIYNQPSMHLKLTTTATDGKALPALQVLPMQDRRSLTAGAMGGDSERWSYALGMIPLMPFGYNAKPYPEQGTTFISLRRYNSLVNRELAETVVMGLKQSGLFGKITFADNVKATTSDYILTPVLDCMEYRGYRWTYGITYLAAPVLWLLGFPTGNSVNELAVSFVLTHRASGKEVWRYDYRYDTTVVHGLYYNVGNDTDGFASLMRHAVESAVLDLAEKGYAPAEEAAK